MTDILPEQSDLSSSVGAGARLKAAREAQGLTLGEVAGQLKLSARQLAALEAEDFSSLPGNTFIRGFVRNYARQLGLDPQPLLDYLAEMLPQERVQIAMPPVREATAYAGNPVLGKGKTSWLLWLSILLGVLLGAAGGYWYIQKPAAPAMAFDDASHRDVAEVPASAPVPLASPWQVAPVQASVPAEIPAPPVPVASVVASDIVRPQVAEEAVAAEATSQIRIATQDGSSWVQVIDADGRVQIAQLIAAHGERTAAGQAPFKLKIGNAPKTKLYYRGQEVDLAPHTRGDVATLELK